MAPATFPGSEIQRGQEVRETRAQIDQAYRDGVREVSNYPVIFVDLDKLRNFHMGPPHRQPHVPTPGYALSRQLERQVSGATEGLLKRINEDMNEGEEYTASKIAREIRKSGPAALPGIVIGSQTYGVALEPSSKYDSKKDLIEAFIEHLDRGSRRAIRENMPGTDSQWMRFVGNHEGAHLNVHEDNKTPLQTLTEEVRADRIASQMAHERGEGYIALAFKDLRALTSHIDPKHASSPLIHNHDDAVNGMHLRQAYNGDGVLEIAVHRNFDWGTYAGKARTTEELLRENPEGYFKAMHAGLDAQTAVVMEAYHNDPNNIKSLEAVIEHQIKTDYMRDFEDAWRRRVLGQDVPERAPTQLITQEQENEYFFQERMRNEASEIAVEANGAYPAILSEVRYDASKLEEYEQAGRELGETIDKAIAAHAENPSFETAQTLIYLEKVLFQSEDRIEFARSVKEGRESKQDAIEEPVLLSDDDRRAYYKERFERKDGVVSAPAQPAVSLQDLQSSATEASAAIYMAVVDDIPKGAPRLDQDDWKMKTPDGAGMPAVFAASANPDPEAVKIVPAFTPPEQVAAVAAVQEAANSSLYTQRSLG